MGSAGIKEKDFLVVMVAKAKKSVPKPENPPAASTPAAAAAPAASTEAAAAPAAAAASPAPATPAPTATAAATPGAPLQQPPNANAAAVANLVAMGFPEPEVQHCLRMAHGNPDIAVEFLTNGIPEGVECSAHDWCALLSSISDAC